MKDIPETDYNNIVGLAKKYALRSYSYIAVDDLIQEGCIAYIKGYVKFDASKSNYYMGFIYKRVVGAMLDYIASNSFKGSSTVRKIDDKSNIQVASLDITQEAYSESYEDALLADVDAELLYERFSKYLEDMTELEKAILVGYFTDRKSMVKLGDELGISRLKVKRIIHTCLSYIKNKYAYSVGNLNFKEISRT